MRSIGRKTLWLGLSLAMLVAALALRPGATQARPPDDITQTCSGTFSNTTFANNVVVPDSATCTLFKWNVVGGDILMGTGATLNVCPDNDIGGSIKAEQPSSVLVTDQTGFPECGTPPPPKGRGITIGGDVRVKGGGIVRLIGNPNGGVAVIKRDVEIKDVQSIEIRDFNNLSSIGRDVVVKNATTVTIQNNVIGGDLEIGGTIATCTEQNNTVAGKKRDACPTPTSARRRRGKVR